MARAASDRRGVGPGFKVWATETTGDEIPKAAVAPVVRQKVRPYRRADFVDEPWQLTLGWVLLCHAACPAAGMGPLCSRGSSSCVGSME